MVELVALALLVGLIAVALFVHSLYVGRRNQELVRIVKKQDKELLELRELLLDLDTGNDMQKALEEVHQHVVRSQQLEPLRYHLS